MSKYHKLSQYLNSLSVDEWVADFGEIETILESDLPDSARRYPAWWSNQAGEGHTQSNAWQALGWRTVKLDLAGEKVTFIREARRPADVVAGGSTGRGITIAEAKAGLAISFGVPPENIEITIRG
jgi:hypothetical protein